MRAATEFFLARLLEEDEDTGFEISFWAGPAVVDEGAGMGASSAGREAIDSIVGSGCESAMVVCFCFASSISIKLIRMSACMIA